MKPIPFSGMMCTPSNIEKDGKFRIKGTLALAGGNHPAIERFEYFASEQERDTRYNMIMNLFKDLPR